MNQPVCFVNTTRVWGGGEKWHLEIALLLQNKGYPVYAISNVNSALYKAFSEHDIPVLQVKTGNLSFLNFFKHKTIVRFYKKHGIKTVILNLSADLKLAGMAARSARVPDIIYRRGSAIPIRNTMLNRFLFRRVITRIIANSEETKKTILANNDHLFPREKIHVIYNGIDLAQFDALPCPGRGEDDRFILGNAGRFVKQKGQKYLVEIAQLLKKKNIPFIIRIAGEGPLKQEIVDLAKDKEVLEYFEFIGFVSPIKCFMDSLDVFVLTSLWEGFGYVMVEAMAGKKPVIAFNISSNPEIVENEKSGYIVGFEDLDSMVEKIIQLYKNKTLRNNMGEYARAMVEKKFSIHTTLKEVEKLLSGKISGNLN